MVQRLAAKSVLCRAGDGRIDQARCSRREDQNYSRYGFGHSRRSAPNKRLCKHAEITISPGSHLGLPLETGVAQFASEVFRYGNSYRARAGASGIVAGFLVVTVRRLAQCRRRVGEAHLLPVEVRLSSQSLARFTAPV